MIDDIKEAVDTFANVVESELSDRDRAGINKIHFELDLLKAKEPRKKSRKKSLTEDSTID